MMIYINLQDANRKEEHTVAILVEFAIALMTILDQINRESFQRFKLRIGMLIKALNKKHAFCYLFSIFRNLGWITTKGWIDTKIGEVSHTMYYLHKIQFIIIFITRSRNTSSNKYIWWHVTGYINECTIISVSERVNVCATFEGLLFRCYLLVLWIQLKFCFWLVVYYLYFYILELQNPPGARWVLTLLRSKIGRTRTKATMKQRVKVLLTFDSL